MIQKDNTIGITKRDILFLINIVKDINNDTKDKRIFATLEDYSIVVDDCDIIKRDLIVGITLFIELILMSAIINGDNKHN